MTRLIWIALLFLATASCQHLPAPAVTQPPVEDDGDAVSDWDLTRLLRYYRELEELPSKEVQAALQDNFAAVADGRCNEARVKLALTLLQQSTPGDEGLLSPCLDDPSLQGSAIRDYLYMIEARLDALRGANQRYDAALGEILRLRAEHQKLSRQVEGLKTIEKSLQERDRRR